MPRIAKYVCPTKFAYARHRLSIPTPKILDIGCGNNSPTTTKHWFPGCHYTGADIEDYNNSANDHAQMDAFYPLGIDGSGYDAIPNNAFDYVIVHHVVEHMKASLPILAQLCAKLKPGGYIWIAFPSERSLSLPSAAGTLQFCDDPTHVHLPGVREITNLLLAHEVKVLHAGRSRSFIREALGFLILPWALLRRWITGQLSARGLWYVLGFEDHVFGQRRPG